MSRYVAAYDVGDDTRRRNVARVLLTYGRRTQESVFEVCIDPEELSDFRLKVGLCLGGEDQFDLYPLDTRPAAHRMRWMRPLLTYNAVTFL